MEIIVPAYCYPERGRGYWEALAQAAAQVPLTVIMNPHNGPGQRVDENYRWAQALVRGAGARVLGYVHTSWTKRPLAQVQQDVDRWLSLYPDLQGFFVDETTSDHEPEHIRYYRALRDYIRERAATAPSSATTAAAPGLSLPASTASPAAAAQARPLEVVGNPGCDASPDYIRLGLFDRLMISESPSEFASPSFPHWLHEHRSCTFAAVVYGITSKERMRELVRDCIRAHIGCVYVTDAGGSNPYDRLPSYWRDLVAFVREVNASPDTATLIKSGRVTHTATCCGSVKF